MDEWPSCFPRIANLRDQPLANDCPNCGHLVALHSRERGCVLCEFVDRYGLTNKRWPG